MKRSSLLIAGAAITASLVLLVYSSRNHLRAPQPLAANGHVVATPPTRLTAQTTPSPSPPRQTSANTTRSDATHEDAPFEGPMFPTDASGHIVKSENVRLNLEKLYALNSLEELSAKLDSLEETLPPPAARELPELMEQYRNYQAAALQTFPPGHESPSPADAVNELDGLHALRVQYFGAATTDAFFASEEKVQRELLRLMALEKDQSLTMEEKAERAQTLYSQSPELARLSERGDRQAASQ